MPEFAAAWAAGITLPPPAARAFLPLVVPVALWVAWSDMARMKIPNLAALALVAIHALVGPLVLPLPLWALHWTNLAVILAAGFALNMAGALGAGDAKFLAAAAPFVPPGDAAVALGLLAALLPAAFLTHRLARSVPAIRAQTAGWTSWTSAKFPMGLALGPALVLYLGLAALA